GLLGPVVPREDGHHKRDDCQDEVSPKQRPSVSVAAIDLVLRKARHPSFGVLIEVHNQQVVDCEQRDEYRHQVGSEPLIKTVECMVAVRANDRRKYIHCSTRTENHRYERVGYASPLDMSIYPVI